MARFKVKALLQNKRRAPVNDLSTENKIGTVGKDFIFESVNQAVNDLGTWYQDRDGYWYLGEWLQPIIELPGSAPKAPLYPWWIMDYGIDAMWKHTKGAGITIAVIDTGLNYNHDCFKGKTNISYYNLSKKSELQADCLDNFGHGTHCAGMIAANGPEIFGIAPEAALLVIKATETRTLSCRQLVDAIEYAIGKANIISVSYEFYKGDADFELLTAAVSKASDMHITVVGCTGNAAGFYETYPANFPQSIGVAASDKKKNIWRDSNVYMDTDLLAPGAAIMLAGTPGQTNTEDSGTSYATPYVAGVLALLFSGYPDKNRETAIAALKSDATDKTRISSQISQYYDNADIADLGVISPFTTYNNLKS